jgi:hypothetical protein
MNIVAFDASNWLSLYRAAVLERNVDQLTWRVGLALEAIDERARVLDKISNGSVEEKRKLDDALSVLRTLLKARVA